MRRLGDGNEASKSKILPELMTHLTYNSALAQTTVSGAPVAGVHSHLQRNKKPIHSTTRVRNQEIGQNIYFTLVNLGDPRSRQTATNYLAALALRLKIMVRRWVRTRALSFAHF